MSLVFVNKRGDIGLKVIFGVCAYERKNTLNLSKKTKKLDILI
jgi:hypothetical protein